MDIERFDVGPRLCEMVKHNHTLYLAGQVPEDTTLDAKGQTAQVLDYIDTLLARAGSDKTRILSAQIFLSDLADYDGMNAAWDAWVPVGHPPARATVQAKLANPAWKVEIVVVAAV
ncbi:RidA family protein [Chitinivorax sp. B]|uniref:RidA family protein n=1 Tax=Chitinivorax sp. B TaxID=2502235 RepID=UPI0010F5A599|nr:RidA family protein [Chitinivorax sp. B]